MIPCEIAPRPDVHIHKWNITSRLELLLAKIAGHDVDLSTMTPPVATNLTEELLLEIADRLDNGGEGGESSSGGTPIFMDFLSQPTADGEEVVELGTPMELDEMWGLFTDPSEEGCEPTLYTALGILDGHALRLGANPELIAGGAIEDVYTFLDNKWHWSKRGYEPYVMPIGYIKYIARCDNSFCIREAYIALAENRDVYKHCLFAFCRSLKVGNDGENGEIK